MADKCKVCKKSVGNRGLRIQCNDCESPFHASCVSLSKEDIEFYQDKEEIWRCNICAKVRRKSMLVESELNKNSPSLTDVMELLSTMRLENKEQITALEKELGKSVENCHENIEDLKNTIKIQTEAIDRYEKKLDELLGENTLLKKRIKELEYGLDDAEQYSRINCIEINGIPEKQNEVVLEKVKIVGAALGVKLTDDMVDTCHRLGSGREKGHRGIIVKFTRRTVKEEILQKRRVKRNLSTADIGETNNSSETIYIGESLTKKRRELYKEVREIKKKKGLNFVWVRNGKILVRPKEGAKVIAVTTYEDLQKLHALPAVLGAAEDHNTSLTHGQR